MAMGIMAHLCRASAPTMRCSMTISLPRPAIPSARLAFSPQIARSGRSVANRSHFGIVRAMSSMPDMLIEKNKENAVMVYSKTWCPFCDEVKSLFKRLNVDAKVVEIDQLADGDAVSDALAGITGKTSVPQVFVGGAHVGGCDDTMAAYKSGQLKTMLAEAGVAI